MHRCYNLLQHDELALSSRAVRRRHCVGGGAQVNFYSAGARRRSQKIGVGGAALAANNNFLQRLPKKIPSILKIF